MHENIPAGAGPVDQPVRRCSEMQQVKRGQLIRLNNYGLVRFDRLDFYCGEVTAKLTGIDHPGSYFPFVAELEKQGFAVIDA